MDPELAAIAPRLPALSLGDLAVARRTLDDLVSAMPVNLTNVRVEDRRIAGPTGCDSLAIRIFTPVGRWAELIPGILSIHGGGFALGTPAIDDASNAAIAREVGAVVISVDYRLAPEHPYPAAAADCYAALVWLAESAEGLGIDPERLAVLGDSAGGGLAATTALLARERGGPRLALQALLEPELDDRLTTPSMRSGDETINWNRTQAALSWEYYLDGQTPASPAVPARASDLSGLPPTYLTVSELDCLRDEGLEYGRRLLEVGVPTELHCWPGAFHGFQTIVPTAAVSQRASASLHDALRRALKPVGATTR